MSDRQRVLETLRKRLLGRGLPRFEMSVIVIGAGLAGFATSVVLLVLGLTSMSVRYPLAVMAAYVVFLGLVRLWVVYHRRRFEADADLADALPDVLPDLQWGGGPRTGAFAGEGGEFGGGGVTGTWEGPSPAAPQFSSVDVVAEDAPTSSAGDTLAGLADVDVDDGAVILIPVALIAAAVLAVGYVVYAAPALLAEVALDAALVSGLYRRLRRLEPRSWLATVVRRTWLPMVVVAGLLGMGGYILQTTVPGADSIGDVFRGRES